MHLDVVAVLLVVVGGDVVAVVAAVNASHQAVAAAGLDAADCLAGAAWMAAQSRGSELNEPIKSHQFYLYSQIS